MSIALDCCLALAVQATTGKLREEITEKDVAGITKLDVSSFGTKHLWGIRRFTALTELDCTDNDLAYLDVSENTALRELNCSYNRYLTELDVSANTALETLWCDRELVVTGLDKDRTKVIFS